jgi:hypothetical protein
MRTAADHQPPEAAMVPHRRVIARRLTAGSATLVLLLLAACGESSGPDGGGGGGGGATLSGTVRAAGTAEALADATVSIGASQATSGADGTFELTGVPVGQATARAERTGYLPAEETVILAAGANSHDFTLNPQEIYKLGSNAVYLPGGVGPMRASIVVLTDLQAGGFVTGEPIVSGTGEPELESGLQSLGASLRTLAKSMHVALLGSSSHGVNSPTSDAAIFTALSTAEQMSGQAGLANAPVLMFGIGGETPEAAGLVARQPERAIGLLAWVPFGLTALTAREALSVPTLVMQHGDDDVSRNAASHATFSDNRSRGGLWALAAEPGIDLRTATSRGNGARIGWIAATLARRLPDTPGDPLIAVDETSGWLGDQTTLDIAAWADYSGDRTAASWLPSESAARSWKTVGTTTTGGGD